MHQGGREGEGRQVQFPRPPLLRRLSSLAYFDSYRRVRHPANLVQAQRDYFGSHTYERTDMEGWHHTLWSDANSADSITTSGYKA